MKAAWMMTGKKGMLTLALLGALFVLSGCTGKTGSWIASGGAQSLAAGDSLRSTLCVDVNGETITGGDSNPLKTGKTCDWVLASLGGKAPCRTKDGYVIYDELGRPLPDDSFCPEARRLVRMQ